MTRYDLKLFDESRLPLLYSRSNLNSSVNFKSYLVIGNLTMIETNCHNVSQTQFERLIDDRFEIL
jgi:hypothetical protein